MHLGGVARQARALAALLLPRRWSRGSEAVDALLHLPVGVAQVRDSGRLLSISPTAWTPPTLIRRPGDAIGVTPAIPLWVSLQRPRLVRQRRLDAVVCVEAREAPARDDGCRSYVKQGMGVGALAVIVGGVVGRAAAGAAAGAGVCGSFQTRRARWRLGQRSASLRDLPSVCLRLR